MNSWKSEQKVATYFSYLDKLRKSGVTNMFGASPYLQEEFGLNNLASQAVLSLWMLSFDETKTSEDRAKGMWFRL